MISFVVQRKSASKCFSDTYNPEFKPPFGNKRHSGEDIMKFKIIVNVNAHPHPFETKFSDFVMAQDGQFEKYFNDNFIRSSEFREYVVYNLENTDISYIERRMWLMSNEDFQQYIIGYFDVTKKDIENINNIIFEKTGFENPENKEYPILSRRVIIAFVLTKANLKYTFSLTEKQDYARKALVYYYKNYPLDPGSPLIRFLTISKNPEMI